MENCTDEIQSQLATSVAMSAGEAGAAFLLSNGSVCLANGVIYHDYDGDLGDLMVGAEIYPLYSDDGEVTLPV